MKPGLKITFKDSESVSHLVDFIEKKYDRFRMKHHEVIGCHVVLSKPHRSQKSGSLYSVSIDLYVPGKELVGRSKNKGTEGGDLFSGILDAFTSLESQITGLRGRRAHGRKMYGTTPRFEEAAPIEKIAALAG